MRSGIPRGIWFYIMLVLFLWVIGAQLAAAQQSPTIVIQTPPRPPRDFWDYWSLVATPAGTVVTLIAGFYTLNRSIRSWKWSYFTKEWSTLMQFILPQAKFMDTSLTSDYKKSFTGDEAIKYEMIARLCIGYLDDLYFIGSRRELDSWLAGSFRLLAGTHRMWLEDHKDAYDARFYEFVVNKLS